MSHQTPRLAREGVRTASKVCGYANCQAPFHGRSDAIFCSPACKAAHWRSTHEWKQLHLEIPVSEDLIEAIKDALYAVLRHQGTASASDIRGRVPERLHPAQPNHWGVAFSAICTSLGLKRAGWKRSTLPSRKGGVESAWRLP